MINRNRNSAVARAQAEMKQAVNSSRRQLNCNRDEFRKGWDAIWPSASEEQAVKSDVQTILRKYRKPTDDMPDIYMLFDRASASDKQTVIDMLNENPQIDSFNSSRRLVRSANRLNSSRYTKDKMIRAMEAAGYWYDDIDSYDDGYVVFRGDYGSMTFDNLNEVADWLDNVVFDDPAVAEEVYAILNSNRRVNSARHMSYKTRKAVEYSINCARRRAGYSR